MTLAVETPRAVFTGSGTRGPFTLTVGGTPITYLAKSQLVVRRYSSTGTPTTLVEGVNYSVSADSVATGGSAASVTLDASQAVLSSSERLEVERVTLPSQSQAFGAASGFSAASTERTLDQIVRILQELDDRADRALMLSPLDSGGYTLPPAAQRGPSEGKQYALGFNTSTGAPQLVEVSAASVFGGDGDKGDVVVSSSGTIFTLVAAKVLEKLLTVDGAGSLLDADKLDGEHASAFALNNAYDVRRYGAACNLRTVRDGAMTTGSAVLTSATAAFTANDVGKIIGVQGAVPNAANGSTKPLCTTIASYQSPTQVTLTAAATRTVTGAEVKWATDDSVAIQAAMAAAGAAGGGTVVVPGLCGIATTLDFSTMDRVVVTSDINVHAVDSTGFNEDLPRSLSRVRSGVAWLGAYGGYMAQNDIGTWEDGTYVKRQGNGLKRILLDCFGQAAGGWRTFSVLAFTADEVTVARFTSFGATFGVTTNRTAAAQWDNVASQQVKVSRSVFVNRGAPVYGAKGLAVWGDKSDFRGNCNYYEFTDCTWLIENDASLDNVWLEQLDTTDFIGCTWNGRAVLHSAESAGASALSIFNGLSHLTELLTTAGAPATETVRLPAGVYNFTATGGTNGTVTSSDLTLTGTTVSTGAAVQFTVGAGPEKLASPSVAGSETITLSVGTWLATASGTGATIKVTAGTAVIAGANVSGTISDVIEVTTAGTVTVTKVGSSTPTFSVKCIGGNVLFTKNGAVSAWTCKIRNANSQARTVTFTSCSGIVVAKNAPTLGAGFHAQNHEVISYDLENVGVLPIIEPGADIKVSTNASPGQAVGSLDYGRRFPGVKAKLALAQSIPDSAWTSITWPTPDANSLSMWAAGAPTRITKGHASNAADSNNVLDISIDASVSFATSATGYRFIAILKNGATRTIVASATAVAGGNSTVISGFYEDQPAPGDYYELQVFQTSGGALNAEATLTKISARAW
ncbi:MAG: hypothetical protein EBR82_07980 [Caulobacteraceae bacterium]|nr:hypothetical protein [Caulobacteraceae bacterium]